MATNAQTIKAPWLDKLPKAIRWRRDIKAVNGVEAIVNFDLYVCVLSREEEGERDSCA